MSSAKIYFCQNRGIF